MPVRLVRLLGALLLLVACEPASEDPRSEIEALLARAENAAEAGDAGRLSAMLHGDFQDAYGRDRRATALMLRTLLGRYARMEIVVRDIEIEILSPSLATAELTVIAVAQDGRRALPAGLDADRRRLRIALRAASDGWLVSRAEWSATRAD